MKVCNHCGTHHNTPCDFTEEDSEQSSGQDSGGRVKVLITGSAGFIGAHLVEHLLVNTDWDIVGLDSFKHRGDSLRVIRNPRYQVHACDLSSPISYRLADQMGEVDFIVNMASESHVDRSITDPVPFVQNNVNLALYMLEYARLVKPKVFVQISTDEVYGPAKEGTKHAEWSMILPSNPYSASKAAQEALGHAYWKTYGVPVVVTNTMNNFGERQDPEKYIPMLISRIMKGERVTVHGTESYIGKRHYLHARNHADAILFLLQQPLRFDQPMLPRFNIVGETEMDNLELAKKVARVLKKDLRYELVDFHSARPGHDPRYALDGSLMGSLGWKPPVDFESSLEKTIHWTLDHLEWLR